MTIHCVLCGKPVKPSAPMVRMTTENVLYGPDYDYKVRPAHDQGYFEIGPDCYRKVLAAGPAGLEVTRSSR
jgi:hypothetical protein